MSDKQWKDMTQAECDEVMKRLLEEPTYLGCGEEEEDQESERARWNARIELFKQRMTKRFDDLYAKSQEIERRISALEQKRDK